MDIKLSEDSKRILERGSDPAPSISNISLSAEDRLFVEANRRDTFGEKAAGLAREVGEGITFGYLGELASAAIAATTDKEYSEALAEYDAAREEFSKRNPTLRQYALPLEVLASAPTGFGLLKSLGKAGIKAAPAAGIEGSLYGFGTGDSFEDRVQTAAVMGLGGYGITRVLGAAIKPEKAGGLKGAKDEPIDSAYDVADEGLEKLIEKETLEQQFTQVEKNFDVTPLREAKTAGDFYEGVKKVFTDFYDQNGRGVSDNLWANVSPQIGALTQRANQAALFIFNKELGNLTKDLVPVIKTINESNRAKGLILDFAKGGYSNKDQAKALMRMATKNPQQDLSKLEASLRKRAINDLLRDLGTELSADQKQILKQYLDYSGKKNSELTKKVFGATSYNQGITYLHTRLSLPARKKKKADEGLTDEQIDDFFEDNGFQERTRGLFRDGEVNPSLYENPLVSDLQRIQKMNQLAQLQRYFGVKTEAIALGKARLLGVEAEPGLMAPRVALTPTEFMNALETSFKTKGINEQGAVYARKQISDMVLGETKAPHPIVQAMQSLAYMSTLAGPMSAILNLADVPLIGAKYGGRSVLEGAKSVKGDFAVFKKPAQIDLNEMGLGNQNFGEFTSALNDLAADTPTLLQTIASKSRQGADLFMRGSGFAAMDRVGKRGVMRGVLKSAVDDANAKKLAENWGFYFGESELKEISSQLLKHGTDFTNYTGKGKELIEELMFAGLGQQQLISSAGRPAGWARNPNLRPLWALRGFVVKQQALALREVVGNIKQGKPDKAAEFLGRYALYGAGGYAVINEGRQMIFGDGNFSAGGLVRGYGDAWVSLLSANTIGLNDYQLGQIKQNGLAVTIINGATPIGLSRPIEIGGKIIEAIDGKRPPQAVLTEFSPLIKQSARAIRNISDPLGMVELNEASKEILRMSNPS